MLSVALKQRQLISGHLRGAEQAGNTCDIMFPSKVVLAIM